MRDVNERLLDIQEAIANIMKYTAQGRNSFNQNELIQVWVIRHLEIIGEAARAIPPDAVAQSRVSNSSRNSLASLDFPVPDPLYIYNQFAYVTSHFQRREAGYAANQGHDRFAAYWTQEMMNNLGGFGAQFFVRAASNLQR